MSEVEVLPELKEIVGAVLFAAKQPVTLAQLTALMKQTAERFGGVTKDFAAANVGDVGAALQALKLELETRKLGLHIAEVAEGFRLENVGTCGPWLRTFLEKGKPNRLSPPALETLAIIAYRQPVMRSEIEVVRGVAVDQILRNLLDMQLIRITGRSELPGRPWLFGTTQKFLEHFGLRHLDDLPGTEELRRLEHTRGAIGAQDQFAFANDGRPAGESPIGFNVEAPDEEREPGAEAEPSAEELEGAAADDEALPEESPASAPDGAEGEAELEDEEEEEDDDEDEDEDEEDEEEEDGEELTEEDAAGAKKEDADESGRAAKED